MINAIILLGIIPTSLCQDSLYITTEPSFWTCENDNCTLATPSVEASTDMNYQLNGSVSIDIPVNESVWVGYYQVVGVFEYIGCVSTESSFINDETNVVDIKGDPGHCFPGCGEDTIIGVSRTRCYCLGSDVNLIFSASYLCTDTCQHPFVACGIEETSGNFLSIYKIALNDAVSVDQCQRKEKNCLAFDPKVPEKFVWESCKEFLSPLCADGSRFKRIYSKMLWKDAARACFFYNTSMRPTISSNFKDINIHNGSKLWTGLFRTKVVYQQTAKVPVHRSFDKKLYGYLTRDSEDNIKLQFTGLDSSQRKLCKRAKQVSTGTTRKSKDDENVAVGILTGTCAILVVLLLVFVSLTCLYKRRLQHNILSQANFITHANSAQNRCNKSAVPNTGHTEEHYDYSFLAGENIYAIPQEDINHENQVMHLNVDRMNPEGEFYLTMEDKGGAGKLLNTASHTIPKKYEMCLSNELYETVS